MLGVDDIRTVYGVWSSVAQHCVHQPLSRCREVLSNIAYIINVRLARVFSRAHHTAISEHLPGDCSCGGCMG